MIAAGAAAATLWVSAAVSLKAPIDDAARRFEALYPGTRVELRFAASGVLVAQIEQGAPADLFLSASPVEIDRLARFSRVAAGSRRVVASNRLVVVVPAGATPVASLADLASDRYDRIAIGNPRTVPAGRYAAEALRAAGIFDAVEKRLIFAENARQVLDYVARGEATAALAYRTDAALLGNAVRAGPPLPATLHSPIAYEGVVVAGAPGASRASAFLDYLVSAEGRSIFVAHGFDPPAAAIGAR